MVRRTTHLNVMYQPSDAFAQALRRRVRLYLRERGLRRFAGPRMLLKSAVLLGASALSYGLILSGALEGWGLTAVQVFFMVSLFIITLGVVHDATHNAYFRRPALNKMLVALFDVLGIDSHYWINNHVRSHHAAPNVPHLDAAIEGFDFLRLHPKARRLWFHRYQHWYAFGVYGLVTLFQCYLLEFASIARGVIGFQRGDGHQLGHWARILVMKGVALSITLLIPMLALPGQGARLVFGFFAGHFAAGLLLGFFFELTHISEGCAYPEPDETGQLQTSFVHHVLLTTVDFAPDSALITWLSGGLNHHVAHHLFPKVSQIHLPALTRIVAQTAAEFGAPYRAYGAREALRRHLRHLAQLGALDTPRASLRGAP